jgi:hypothetical protein
MSDFTRFSAIERLGYDVESSRKYGKDIWSVAPGYRYYIGFKGSTRYVDVEDGFLTDGATIPRFLWWLLPPLGEYSQATSLHDKLCRSYYILELINGVETQVPVTRAEIDAILKEALEVLEVKKWKETCIMAGVNAYRLFTNPTEARGLADSL